MMVSGIHYSGIEYARMRRVLLGACVAMIVASCGDERVIDVVVHRDSCLVCHTPLNEAGEPHGLEQAHPWAEISCTGCHGGDARICDGTEGGTTAEPTCDGEWVYDKDLAHPVPAGGPIDVRRLSAAELDEVDRDWLRFINPGDLRVAADACGACHAGIVESVATSLTAHTAGELSSARRRSGRAGEVAAGAADLESVGAATGACEMDAVARFVPPDPGEPGFVADLGTAQDIFLGKQCLSCHLGDYGEGRFPGDHRSSGCSACHVEYAEDGRSASDDPTLDPYRTPRPEKHTLAGAASVEQCASCHHDGARVGLSYRGWRERSDEEIGGLPLAVGVGRVLHGHDGDHYVVDEDASNGFDETPPDVHFEAGMSCVDCHSGGEVHGSGHLVATAWCAPERATCAGCHGSADAAAAVGTERYALTERDGAVVLTTRRGGLELEVPQIVDLDQPGHEAPHLDTLACETCHSGWLPSCYGCHASVDLMAAEAADTTGVQTAGRTTTSSGPVALHDLVLVRGQDGLIVPSMPAERLFLTLTVEDPTIFEPTPKVTVLNAPRSRLDAEGAVEVTFGQRAIHPHTVRRRSAFMACDRCHSVGDPAAPSNKVLLDLTHGFGTQRYPQQACDIEDAGMEGCVEGGPARTFQLDAVIAADGSSLVEMAPPSRPLTLDEIDAMRAVTVPADAELSTPIPLGAGFEPGWPGPQNVE